MLIAIAAAVVIALIALVAVLVTRGSVDRWIAKRYHRVTSGVYTSPKPPQRVSAEITKKFKAINRVDDLATLGPGAGGIFLQYPKTMVGVLAQGTGSRITVDVPSSGYNRYHSHVGGHWSSPGSNGWNSNGMASFRGGGPGSGK